MSTSLKMFLLAVFAVILVMAVGCVPENKYVECEAPYYTGPIDYGWTSRDGTILRLPDGQRLAYTQAIRCVFYREPPQ